MNFLKEKKRLIDWEEELNVWIPGINLEEHFIEYTKMDAFDKFSIGNTIYGWNLSLKMLYQHILNGFNADINNYNEFQKKIFNLYQEKPLKDWENEYGVRIVDICLDEHEKFYFKRDFLKKLNSNFIIEKIRKDVLNNDVSKDINVINLNKNMKNSLVNSRIIKPKERSLLSIVNVKQHDNKNKKIKKNIIKSSFAIALSIITAVSSYGITKTLFKVKSDDIRQSVSGMVSVTSSNDNINTMRKCVIDDSLVKHRTNSNVVMSNTKKEKNIQLNREDNNSFKLKLGSKIKLNSKSKIFCKSKDCINNSNGFKPYFSFDAERYIKCVTLDYNGSILDSKNQKEIDYLISDGAKILVIGTSINENSNIADEGYYNYKDAKVLCKASGVL